MLIKQVQFERRKSAFENNFGKSSFKNTNIASVCKNVMTEISKDTLIVIFSRILGELKFLQASPLHSLGQKLFLN